jgi:hypothetical protein
MLGRRSLLRIAATLPVVVCAWPLAGCTSDSPEPADPDRESVEAALAAEEALAAAIASWPAASSYQTALVAAHTAVLRETLGMSSAPASAASSSPSTSATSAATSSTSSATTVSTTGSTTGSTTSRSDVVRAANDTERSHLRALTSVSAAVSPLLASLAASDAALAESLQPSSPWLTTEAQAS